MSAIALLVASVAYGAAAVLHVFARRRRRLAAAASIATLTALVLQALVIAVQIRRGLPPDLFDWLQVALFAFVLVFALWQRGGRGAGGGAFVLPLAFLLSAASVLLGRGGGVAPLHPTGLLWLHVSFLASGFACLALAGTAALLRRLAESRLRQGTIGQMAPLPQLHRAVQGFLAAGLVLDALGIGAGAMYAKLMWGAYWSWDAKETATLVVWIIDAVAYAAVRIGRRIALGDWLAALGLVGMLVNVWAVGLLGGPHSFNW